MGVTTSESPAGRTCFWYIFGVGLNLNTARGGLPLSRRHQRDGPNDQTINSDPLTLDIQLINTNVGDSYEGEKGDDNLVISRQMNKPFLVRRWAKQRAMGLSQAAAMPDWKEVLGTDQGNPEAVVKKAAGARTLLIDTQRRRIYM
ncbi:hypothetical protein TWF192_006735 [Orbilia oligospora]|uniref:Uncharacterized protein n=1 Tax=Orbilia oligospora TaxID=2813651 RepID=A0A6G1M5Y3_ORBOL|nr:hypothetical protein TWF191_010655 [Orbilia oligospora]KAF3246926.1 hypothetical protein TWF192_006735 [Orbilia oligospora]